MLKSCPFSVDVKHTLRVTRWLGEQWWYSIFCECGAEGPRSDTEDGAEEMWNERVSDE